MKRSVRTVILFLGFLVCMVGLILDRVLFPSGEIFDYALSIVPLFIFPVIFVFSKKEALINAGYVLAGLVGVQAVCDIVVTGTIYVVYVGEILMLLAALIHLGDVVLKFFGFSKSKQEKKSAAEADRDLIDKVMEYKALAAEEVISAEEFDALKGKLFGTQKETGGSLSDLKKWKKLLDQGVLSKEEFSKIKANVLR